MRFIDRTEAGRALAKQCRHLKSPDTVVLGLPRGGVPVACEVADVLGAPLDVIVVRKVGVPWQPELAMGAVGEEGVEVRNGDVIRQAGVSEADLLRVQSRERDVVSRRARQLRRNRVRQPLQGRTAVIVDDGIATGATAQAACLVAREHGARHVVLAVPVAPARWVESMGRAADEYICVASPEPFSSVGQWYRDFTPVSDEDVVECLARRSDSAGRGQSALPHKPLDQREERVQIPLPGVSLVGDLTIPPHAKGVVVFAHGSGSSRLSPRNRAVAQVLKQAGLGTLLFDLLTEHEARDRSNVFDVELLGGRLVAVTDWLRGIDGMSDTPIGYFGASTGAAAALWAAADLAEAVAAVVSRGGRPDLAAESLAKVTAPTLLIVGGRDEVVLDMNRAAQQRLRCRNSLVVIEGATHLFEEPGALQKVAHSAIDWFQSSFTGGPH